MGNSVVEAQLGAGVGIYEEYFHVQPFKVQGSTFRVHRSGNIGSGFKVQRFRSGFRCRVSGVRL
jgi:hypothetical protein